MFYRVDNSLVEGTGLGLYLVNECVTTLKGKLSIDSEKNIGTSIMIEIPDFNETTNEGRFISKMRRLLRIKNESEMTV